MKKWLVIIGIFCVSFSCSTDEERNTVDDSLEGEWILSNISCFCFFEEDTDFSTTRLRFNTKDGKVTVDNTGSNTYFKESGTYTYSSEGNVIRLSATEAYVITIKGSSLQLVFEDNPDVADDEVSYSFIR